MTTPTLLGVTGVSREAQSLVWREKSREASTHPWGTTVMIFQVLDEIFPQPHLSKTSLILSFKDKIGGAQAIDKTYINGFISLAYLYSIV